MSDSNPAKPKRRWCQFSLRTLCLFALVVSIGASYLGVKLEQEKERRKAIAAIEKLGGSACGPDLTARPSFGQPVEGIGFSEGNSLTDDGLEHLKGFTQLRILFLTDTKVTDAGLEHLKGFTQLEFLQLDGTKVTDDGLEHLKGFRQLEQLVLIDTKVTDAGLEHLKGFTQLEFLQLDGTKVTDSGLEYLKGLTQLRMLYLKDTEVTDDGVEKLKQALPNCEIKH